MFDRQPERPMSSTPSRSPLLPPYAAPFAGESEKERSAGASARTPFVPPTYAPRFSVRPTGSGAVSDELTPSDEAQVSEVAPGFADDDFAPAPDADRDESLPWIEAFAEDEVVSRQELPAEQTMAAEHEASPRSESPTPTDTWAIADATVSISHLAQDLTAASGITPPTPALELHTPWKDDEAWMDIMPALPNSGSADPAMDTSWARAFAEPPAPMLPPPLPAGDAQAAASSLEAVARRLRSGELRVPGFHAEAGDAAALAATLASLLGGRE